MHTPSSWQAPPLPQPGQALADLPTPTLWLDAAAFERNLRRAQRAADAAGVALRPHGKAHKCPEIARAQLALGAVGICCQKVSEAWPFLQAGVRDILISNQPASAAQADWLAGWAAPRARAATNGTGTGTSTSTCPPASPRTGHPAAPGDTVNPAAEPPCPADAPPRLAIVVDDRRQIDWLDAATRRHGSRLQVLVEIDVGQGRCGVHDAQAVRALVAAIDAAPGLDWDGLQAYQGALQHLRGADERRAAVRAAAQRTRAIVEALRTDGRPPRRVSGGGTGSLAFDLDPAPDAERVLTELQPGSYAFLDRDYADNQPDAHSLASDAVFEPALFLSSTVISSAGDAVRTAGAPWRRVLDAGLKSLATDSGPPRPCAPQAPWSHWQANDEHGVADWPADAHPPAAGQVLQLIPGHCDPTFNLHDTLVVVRDGRVEAVWPIAARGCSR
ncbi:MAG: hypothetical protein RLY78_3900 [Pseudomonadota bacterium]